MIPRTHIVGRRNTNIIFLLFLISLFMGLGNVFGQEKYILGQEQKLEIVVHIIGEVRRPGEYRVLDGTTVLELLTKAGGPTEFSNISSVTVTHTGYDYFFSNGNSDSDHNSAKRVSKVNLKDYLRKPNAPPPLKLQPGDVVVVPRNTWFKWRNIARVARDISVVASLYFLYLRATK